MLSRRGVELCVVFQVLLVLAFYLVVLPVAALVRMYSRVNRRQLSRVLAVSVPAS